MELPENISIFEHLNEGISLFLNLEKNVQIELAKAFNQYGADLSLSKIEKITGYKATIGDANLLRGTLANIIHNFSHHKDQYDDDLKKSTLPDSYKENFKIFIEMLDEKGLHGLNSRFEARRGGAEYSLIGMSSINSFKEISDENNKALGYLPITKIYFEIANENEEPTQAVIEFELDDLHTFLRSLKNVYLDAKSTGKRLKEKTGNYTILTEEE